MIHDRVYWIVWAEGGGSPTVKHVNFASARAEAQRLARSNPGVTFAVLASVVSYQRNDLRETTYDLAEARDELLNGEIPF